MIYGNSINMVRKSSSSVDYSDIWSESFNCDHTLNAMRFNNILTEASSPEVLYEQLIALQEGFIKDIFEGILKAIKKFKDWLVNTVKSIFDKRNNAYKKAFKEGQDTFNKEFKEERIKKLKEFFANKKEGTSFIATPGFTLKFFNVDYIISVLKAKTIMDEIFDSYKVVDNQEEYDKEMENWWMKILKNSTNSKLHKFLDPNNAGAINDILHELETNTKSFMGSLGVDVVLYDSFSDNDIDTLDKILESGSKSNFDQEINIPYKKIQDAATEFANYCEENVNKAYRRAIKNIHPDSNNGKTLHGDEIAELKMLKDVFSKMSSLINGVIAKGNSLEFKNIVQCEMILKIYESAHRAVNQKNNIPVS